MSYLRNFQLWEPRKLIYDFSRRCKNSNKDNLPIPCFKRQALSWQTFPSLFEGMQALEIHQSRILTIYSSQETRWSKEQWTTSRMKCHIFAWRWRNWLRSRSEIARQLFSTEAHICFRRNSKVCRFHQRNGLRWTPIKGKSLCRNSEKFNYRQWTKMMTSQGLGRDGHSEQTRFAVERPFRLLKAEKNESKQYIWWQIRSVTDKGNRVKQAARPPATKTLPQQRNPIWQTPRGVTSRPSCRHKRYIRWVKNQVSAKYGKH